MIGKMLAKLRNMTIAARLVASFALIVAIFMAYIGVSSYATAETQRLDYNNINFVMARTEIVLDFHQEFTEARRFLGTTFMDPIWRAQTGFTAWLRYEQTLTENFERLVELSQNYVYSLLGDEVFPIEHDDRRLYLMAEIMYFMDTVYYVFSENFFQGRNMSFEHDYVLDYTWAAEEMLRELRHMEAMNRATNLQQIAETEDFMRNLTIVAIVLAVISSITLAFLMVRVFRSRIKAIASDATMIAQGNFDVSLGAGNDEISKIFSTMADVITGLTVEINLTMEANKVGDIDARIDSERFSGGYKDAALAINSLLDNIATDKFMFDHMPLLAVIFDKNYNVLDVSSEVVRKYKASHKSEYINNFLQFSPEFQPCGRRSDEMAAELIDRAFAEGAVEVDWINLDMEGNEIPVHLVALTTERKGEPLLITYAMDMTAVKENQEKLLVAQENSQAKTKFLATMSHEIRTPISAVLGISEIQLQNPNLAIEVEEAFAKIYDSSNKLLIIINDILDISRIEAGKMEIVEERYEVASLIVDTMQMHLVYLGSKRIDFTLDADENMPSNLYGDEVRLKQVINNILSNSFKYTDSGKVTLEVGCEYIDDKRGDGEIANLIIKIADTGIGMTEQQVAGLFDDYARFHEATDRFTPGTGLGMPIAYNFVSLMNGTIDVQSEVGVGTTVTLCIPQKISGNNVLGIETVENVRRREADVLASTKRMNFVPEPMPYGSVLVVDDIETNLYVAKGLMGFYGLNIETAGGGYEAIEKIEAGLVYDIIFMDHMMPDINGMETTQKLREMGYTEPIVALTANALIGQAEEFMRNGFDGFISKPINTTHLNSILQKFIRDKQPPEVIALAKAAAEAEPPKPAPNIDEFFNDPGFNNKLYKDFIRSQKSVIYEIEGAVEAGDLESAHRLAHTLKGLAGLISESDLAALAQKAEASFREGIIPDRGHMEQMTAVLDDVLVKITERLKDSEPVATAQMPPKAEVEQIFDEVAELLENDNAAVLDIVDKLAAIPKTEELIEQIEDFDFQVALETLNKLRITTLDQMPPKAEMSQLFDEVAELLENDNASVLDIADKLTIIPGAAELIDQIEDFDFAPALQTLNKLRKTLNC
ncbi:MAG: response regulator [Clostridiales bacterium]|jgi:signal transduction histidine kinase/CheY-like chemotaxis protein/HPt (histidine-containing phosphotransfer) domain-containing protein|nr:response regulator [Clostridiales bacterium]